MVQRGFCWLNVMVWHWQGFHCLQCCVVLVALTAQVLAITVQCQAYHDALLLTRSLQHGATVSATAVVVFRQTGTAETVHSFKLTLCICSSHHGVGHHAAVGVAVV
jgi:hypothetical protein